MSIQDTYEFDNRGEVVKFPLVKRFFLSLVIILVALLAFGLGRLSGQGVHSGVSIDYDPNFLEASSTPERAQTAQTSAVIEATVGQVTASSKGTKYYYSTCKNTISAANKITFTSASEAEKAGYTLAANCHK